jgi:hypothetical protein
MDFAGVKNCFQRIAPPFEKIVTPESYMKMIKSSAGTLVSKVYEDIKSISRQLTGKNKKTTLPYRCKSRMASEPRHQG